MIPYNSLVDDAARLSAERIVKSLGLEKPAFPITGLFVKGLDGLRFSYYGGLLVSSRDFANLLEQLPAAAKEYLLRQVHLFEPTIIGAKPKGFPMIKPGRDMTLDDLLSDAVVCSRTREYYAPVEGETAEEKVAGVQRRLIAATDFIENLPGSADAKPAYLIGFENILNLTTFLAYAAYNSQLQADVNSHYTEPFKNQDPRATILIREDFYWPHFKQAAAMAALGYLLAVVGSFESAKAVARRLKKDESIFSDALHFFVEGMLDYRVREGDKLESIILHTLNFLNSNEVAKKGHRLNFYSIFWGGSYVAPLMAGISSLLRGTEDEFDYLQFSSHQIKVHRQAFIEALKTDVHETSVQRRRLGDVMRIADLRGKIAGRMLNYAKSEVPIFATRNLKNEHDIVISDDNIGTGLTMYFNYMLATWLDTIHMRKHVIVSPIAGHHSFYETDAAPQEASFAEYAQQLLGMKEHDFIMATIELLGRPRDYFRPTFRAQDPRSFELHSKQVVEERQFVT